MIKKSVVCLPLLLSGCGLFAVSGIGSVGMSAAEERGIGGVASDHALRLKLNYELADFSGIELTVYNGRVLLTGVADNEKVKADALHIVKHTSGVKEVIDGMNVRGEDGFSEYARDAWMTTKLKATLYSDEDVFAPNYVVKTFDKIIYIFGFAQTKNEMQFVIDHAHEITGVKKVVNLIEVRQMPKQSRP